MNKLLLRMKIISSFDYSKASFEESGSILHSPGHDCEVTATIKLHGKGCKQATNGGWEAALRMQMGPLMV